MYVVVSRGASQVRLSIVTERVFLSLINLCKKINLVFRLLSANTLVPEDHYYCDQTPSSNEIFVN